MTQIPVKNTWNDKMTKQPCPKSEKLMGILIWVRVRHSEWKAPDLSYWRVLATRTRLALP